MIPEAIEPDETVTLGEAKRILRCLGPTDSILFLSAPGIGKTMIVQESAADAGLACRSLLGTQIAAEDVSGVPRIVGERSVFCPPRVLLPEDAAPFCLLLDELPAASGEVQKALYSVLLERRIGEHRLPAGSWVVAAGNRTQDRALVRSLSSALLNRVFVIHIRADVTEWLRWARTVDVLPEIRSFICFRPEALSRSAPETASPFSTPRAWASLSSALQLARRSGDLTPAVQRSLAFGRISAEDAAVFCAVAEGGAPLPDNPERYVRRPDSLPAEGAALWLAISAVREKVRTRSLSAPATSVNRFLEALSPEHRMSVLVDLVPHWGALGAGPALLSTLDAVAP